VGGMMTCGMDDINKNVELKSFSHFNCQSIVSHFVQNPVLSYPVNGVMFSLSQAYLSHPGSINVSERLPWYLSPLLENWKKWEGKIWSLLQSSFWVDQRAVCFSVEGHPSFCR
jgi:hypothetical protein